jgi:DNA sulfur modification protein DndB
MSEEKLILPAVKGKLGIRDYYSTTMKIKDIAERMDFASSFISPSSIPSERLQRKIDPKRTKEITSYLQDNNERFFNSLVVGLFGDPKWKKFSDLPAPLAQFEHNIGFLTLSEDDKMYAIDGQHRLSGIKKYLAECQKDSNETVPIVFIQHEDTDQGKKRSRRLFTVLNKKAQRVSNLDIIYLDEDDTAAIITRKFLEDKKSYFFYHPKSEHNRVHAISSILPPKNSHSFTVVESLYASIMELVMLFTGKIKKHHQNQASSEDIDGLYEQLTIFFNLFIGSVPEVKSYFEADVSSEKQTKIASQNRNNEGGHILFRPAGFTCFIKSFHQIYKKHHSNQFNQQNIEGLLKELSKLPFILNKEPCLNLVWDSDKQKILPKFPMMTRIYTHMMGCTTLEGKHKDSYFKMTGRATLPQRISQKACS